jgi:hypothetical protein
MFARIPRHDTISTREGSEVAKLGCAWPWCYCLLDGVPIERMKNAANRLGWPFYGILIPLVCTSAMQARFAAKPAVNEFLRLERYLSATFSFALASVPQWTAVLLSEALRDDKRSSRIRGTGTGAYYGA